MNHQQEAEEHVTRTHSNQDWGGNDGDAFLQAQIAQVHATLALVEQQRIANLIALAGIPNQSGYESETHDARNIALFEGIFDWEDITTPPDNPDQQIIIRPEIAEALGLGDTE